MSEQESVERPNFSTWDRPWDIPMTWYYMRCSDPFCKQADGGHSHAIYDDVLEDGYQRCQ